MPHLPTRLRRLGRTTTVGLLVAGATAPALRAQQTTATGEALPVHTERLDNGMTVLILERPGAPTVSTVVRFGVGGVNEVRGETGIAHLLEHLLFKGTSELGTTDVAAERAFFERMDAIHDRLLAERARTRPDSTLMADWQAQIAALEDSARAYVIPNEFDRILARAGARGLNATTDSEATTYYVELPANRLELWFAMESDRMRDPVFREFYSERDVVAEERRQRTETLPGGRLYEAHMRAAYTVHPYGQPVVGWMSDIESLSRAQVEEYYRRFYGPDNAVVAIVGAVDPEQVAAWAHEYFGDLPPGETPAPVYAPEPPQRGEKRLVVEFESEPAVRIGWHVPAVSHEDTPALIMLTSLLTGGRTSRLFSRLVEEDRVATGVTSSIGPGARYPQLFQIDAQPRSPATTEDVEAAIYDELRRMADEGPSPDAVRRIANQYEAGEYRRLYTNLGLALQLANAQALFGDWKETFRYSSRISEVTAEKVQEVAGRYFDASNRTVATLQRPASGSERAPRSGGGDR